MHAAGGISGEEHRDRQARCARRRPSAACARSSCSPRGGGTHDRTGDALWLAGLAASQPFVPDLPGHWRGAGHVAVVLPVDGACTAIVESDELQAPPVADEVVVSADVIGAAAAAIGRDPRVGVLGSDAIPASWWAVLDDGAAVLEPADDLVLALRRRKSPAERDCSAPPAPSAPVR